MIDWQQRYERLKTKAAALQAEYDKLQKDWIVAVQEFAKVQVVCEQLKEKIESLESQLEEASLGEES